MHKENSTQNEVDSLMFQKDLETMPRRELEALQLERLKWTVGFCRDNIPFYRERLDKAGVTPERLKVL